MEKLLILALSGVIGPAWLLASRADTQTIGGCRTMAAPKADLSIAARPTAAAECFGEAEAHATEAGKTPGERTTAAMPKSAPEFVPFPQVPGATQLASIASNFAVSAQLVPASGNGAIPPSMKPDVVGAFRFICTPSHNSYDDPVIYPGQPGRSHLHTFFGNTKADAHSTYESLRRTGESTCNNPLNRSAYWIPAMMRTDGKVVMPDYVSIYYKRRPTSDPECARMGKACVDLPRGLRYVFGYDMATGRRGGGYFNCDGPGATQGHYPSIPAAARHCPAGTRLGAVIQAPDCWDGKNLDSPDHRSHMAYPSWDGSDGHLKCPKTHPYVVPAFQLGAWYMVDDTLDRSGDEAVDAKTWHLSSDRMPGMAPTTPGTTLHADWFGAWDDQVMQAWMRNCIDKMLSCTGGDLGDGKQLRMFDGFRWEASPRVMPAPTRPAV